MQGGRLPHVGSSLCGMNTNELCTEAAPKGGLVMIGFAATRLDSQASIRIWGLLDNVMLQLADVLELGPMPMPACKCDGDALVKP